MKKSPTIFPILAVVFTNILGAGMVLPILPLYAVDLFGATDFQAALLTTAFFAAQFVAAPSLGQLSDRIGRRPVLMTSQFGTFLAFILFLYAEELGAMLDVSGFAIGITGGLVILFIARSLDGITGGNITTAQAYISDVSTEEKRTESLGLLSAAMGTAFIIGPAVGGLLAGIDIRMPFIGAALITLATIALTFFTLVETRTEENRAADKATEEKFSFIETLKNPNLLIIILMGFIAASAFSALPPTFSLYMDRVIYPDISDPAIVAQRVGWVFMANGVYAVITQGFLIKPLVRHFGERRLVLLGFTIWAIGMFIFPLLRTGWAIALGLFPYAFARGIIDPSLQSLATRFSTAQTRGRVLGLFQASTSIAMIFGPIWAGWVFGNISPASVFTFSGMILVVGWFVAIYLQRVDVEPSVHTIRLN